MLSYPAHGHINPTLPVVRELVSRGHRVTYVVPEQYDDKVAAAGAEVVVYPSLSPAEWANVSVPQHPTADQLAQSNLDTVRETLTPLPAIVENIYCDRPDLVVYDTLGSAAGRLLSLVWGLPSVVLCTTFTWNERFSPYDELPESEAIPQPEPDHPVLVESQEVLRSSLDIWGLTDVSVEDFLLGRAERCRAVCMPREFHPGHETFDGRYYFVGPCLRDASDDEDWTPPEGGLPVVLVSPGTLGYSDLPDLFRTVLRAVDGAPWHVVVATGGVDHADLGPVPSNVELHQQVPQLSVLRHASAFVSHGGMNSAMEALSHGVPLVELAQTGEQRTVANRVDELGLGRALDPESLEPEDLRRAIDEVLQNDSIVTAVRRMREQIAATGGACEIADIVESQMAEIG
jgi:MGT family glycosyltransferase